MIFYRNRRSPSIQRFYRTQQEARQAGISQVEPFNVPTDHHGLCDFLNDLIASHATIERLDRPEPALSEEERLEAALARRQNLDQQDVESAEDLLRKVRGGRQMSAGQLNLIDVLYDKAHRRANFSHLPDYLPVARRASL